jgi:hypothetical protein
MADKPRGRPFTGINDPRRGKSPGRPRKTVEWKEAEEHLRSTIPLLLMMTEKDLREFIKGEITVGERLAIDYIRESPVEAINRMLGKIPTPLTGAEGKPLIPNPVPAVNVNLPAIDFSAPMWTAERLDQFIMATAALVKKA